MQRLLERSNSASSGALSSLTVLFFLLPVTWQTDCLRILLLVVIALPLQIPTYFWTIWYLLHTGQAQWARLLQSSSWLISACCSWSKSTLYFFLWSSRSLSVTWRNTACFYSKSNKQKLITRSSAEAELIALDLCVVDIVWFRSMLEFLGAKQLQPTIIYEDNQSAMLLATG